MGSLFLKNQSLFQRYALLFVVAIINRPQFVRLQKTL